MKNWVIKKKPRSDTTSDQTSKDKNIGGVNSVFAPHVTDTEENTPAPPVPMEEIVDAEEFTDDHNGSVEFDLLDSLDVMAINKEVSPYDAFKHPLGSVRSVLSSQTTNTSLYPGHHNHFNLIVDSGCTKHMFPYKELFISYKDTPSSFVILADKSKVSCSGVGTVRLFLRNKSIILHDVFHVPKLRSPLLSVWCFSRLAGCSFIADNSGSFLTFPNFILPVDDSSDCTIPEHSCPHFDVDFDSRNTGSATAVIDNTRFKHNR
jgi:hypothetical protein